MARRKHVTAAAQRKYVEQFRRREAKLDSASSCFKCRRRLKAEPPPLKTKRSDPWATSRWSRVAIRCLYCHRTYCPSCARHHFRPTHAATPCQKVAVKPTPAYVVTAGGIPLAAVLNKREAEFVARRIRAASGVRHQHR